MAVHPPRSNLAALTGLRFVAAVAVVFHHFGQMAVPNGPLRNLAAAGFVGVDLFFILSGFVLVYVYRPFEVRVGRPAFLAARVARIYPLHALALALSAPIFFSSMASRSEGASLLWRVVVSAGLHVTMTHSWVGHVGVWNVPDWSLSSEWFFYLVFPWLVPPLVRTTSVLRLVVVATALCAAGVGLSFIHHAWHPEWIGGTDAGTRLGGMLKYSPFGRLHEFLCGAILARIWLLARPIPGAGWMTATSLVIVVGVLSRAHLALLPVSNGLLAPVFAVLLLGLAEGGGIVGRVLASAPVVRLGEASYGVYILHWPIALLFVAARGWLGGPREIDVRAFWLYLVIVIVASVLAFELVEAPMRQRIRAAIERRLT